MNSSMPVESKDVRSVDKNKSWKLKIFQTLAVFVWLIVALLLSNALVYGLFKLGILINLFSNFSQNLLLALGGFLIYLFLLLFIGLGVYLSRRFPRYFGYLNLRKKDWGVGGWLTWQQLFLAMAAFIVTMATTAVLLGFLSQLVPGLDLNQSQDIGVSNNLLYNRTEFLLVFLLLVIVTPIAEELAFRGFLYGRLRQILPKTLAIVLVSLSFGVAHGQWNVGIVTFVMSIAMCLCREATKSIYPAILIHIFKNALAFVLLFILKVPQ